MLRKTTAALEGLLQEENASMRPQHDAAENGGSEVDVEGASGASMRPQHDAAENNFEFIAIQTRLHASMRPQHDAAENDGGRRGRRLGN